MGCRLGERMAITEGDTVHVHYTGKLEDGTVFDTSDGKDPLSFQVGGGQVIPGFDAAVAGKEVGHKETVTIPAEQAYGTRNEELVQEFPRERVTGEYEVGQVLGLQDDQGRPFQAQVLELSDDLVKLDFNHFLAGKTLVFDIEVVSVE